jgi:hypothetical protein
MVTWGEAGRLVILDTFGLAFAGDTSQDLMTTHLVRTWCPAKGGVFEVIASENTSKRRTLETMAILILPKTLVGRLTVLGFIFGVISGNTPYEISWIPGFMAFLVWVWAFAVAVRNSLREKGRRAVCLLRTLAATVGVIVGFFALGELVTALAFMAAGGSGTLTFNLLNSSSSGSFGGIEVCLALATVVLLFWIPHVFFRIQLDMTGAGDSQRVLLGLITMISCIVTGVCFLLLHFGGGRFVMYTRELSLSVLLARYFSLHTPIGHWRKHAGNAGLLVFATHEF